MEINIYDVIRKPRISTKVYRLNQEHGQLVLEVHPQANKPMIAEALKKLFNVDVEKVRVVVSKGKKRRSGRFFFQDEKRKKAIVTLKPGQSIDAMNLVASAGVSEMAQSSSQGANDVKGE